MWKKLIEFLWGGNIPQRIPRNRPFYHFEIKDQILYLKREEVGKIRSCLVVPKVLIPVAYSIAHNDSHLGEHKAVAKAKQYFYRPTFLKDVKM